MMMTGENHANTVRPAVYSSKKNNKEKVTKDAGGKRMPCNDKCIREYNAKPAIGGGYAHYQKGLKRCMICLVWIDWEELWCPCCNVKLRTKPRKNMAKNADKRGEKRIDV